MRVAAPARHDDGDVVLPEFADLLGEPVGKGLRSVQAPLLLWTVAANFILSYTEIERQVCPLSLVFPHGEVWNMSDASMGSRHLLRRDRAVLNVIDIQEKLAARMPEKEKVTANSRKLILAARRLEVPVVVTEQYPKGLGRTVGELVEALAEAYAPIEKTAFGCLGEPEYVRRLEELSRGQLLLCGMETHVCVLQTCLALLERGWQVHVAADAVCSRDPEHKGAALDEMRHAGATVTCAEAAIFQLLEKAGTPEFKDLLEIIK